MRDVYKAIAFVEHTLTRGLDRKAAPPRNKRRPSSYVWHARATATDIQYPEQLFKPKKDKPMIQPQLTVTARAMKVTVPLDAAVVATLPTPDGQSRSKLIISCEGKSYTADIATKSLRKVKTTIAANGAENVFVMVQGKLKGGEIVEAGITAQMKVPKPAASLSKAEEEKT
jgi:hypothetical protein